jgi:hypothetical protein
MKKKPPAKKSKPKPKTKQKQTQTQNVIINLSDVRKRTRRKMTSSGGKRPLPLSSFSGSAQAPIYVNPHGSAYRDLIRPLKEHQREMRAAAQDDLRRSDRERELLRSEFKQSQAARQAGQSAINRELIQELRATKQRGNVEQVTPAPTAGDLEDPIGAPTVGDLEDLTPDPIGESSSAPTKEEKPKKKGERNKEQDKSTRAKTKERRDRAALTNTDNETEVKPAKARKSSRNTAKNGSFGGVLGSLED